MTHVERVEEYIIKLIHREPFFPFVMDMADGSTLEIPHGRLAIAGGGAVFLSPDDGFVDFQFKNVRRIAPIVPVPFVPIDFGVSR